MVDTIQTSLNGGEIAPSLYGRVDLAKYETSLKAMLNFIPLLHGPAQNRSGTEFINETQDSEDANDYTNRLIDFEFSVTQAYIVEMNNLLFRFYMDGGIILSGANPYTLATPYTYGQLNDVDYCQSADTMYLAHASHYPRKLTRTDHNVWTLTRHELIDGPWNDENDTAITLDPDGVTGNVTVTASAAAFVATDVHRYIRFWDGSNYKTLRITVFTSTTVVDADVVGDDLGAHAASTKWSLGKWNDLDGWPSTVTFDNDRLCWSGCPAYPQDIAMSKVGIYADHGVSDTMVDDDALYLTLGAKKSNAIKWLRSGKKLTIGTTAAEWWLASATGNGPITALSKQAIPMSYNGSDSVPPAEAGGSFLHLQRHGKVLREVVYSFESDAFVGEKLTLLASHLTEEHRITAMAFQTVPNETLWCVREDGVLLSLCYYREHEIYGWARHSTTHGVFESVAVIPGDGEDELWVIVKRVIDGATVRYVERLKPFFVGTDTQDAFFIDSGLTLDNRQDIESINLTTDVVTVTGHGLVNGDNIRFRVEDDLDADEGDEGSLNMEEFEVSDKTDDTFKCKDIDTSEYIDFSDYTQIKATGNNTIAKNVTVISGLDHLEAESVTILADGGQLASETVSGGEITLDRESSVVHIGLGYDCDIEILPPEIEIKTGTSQALTKRVSSVTLRLHKTVGGSLGPDEDNLIDIPMLDDTVPAGQPVPLFSGDTEPQSFEGTFTTQPTMMIRQDQPLPMTVSAIISTLEME